MSLAYNSSSGEPDDDGCPICGYDREWVPCWQCHGDGGFDAADDDPVNFAPDEEIETCEECGGRGGYLQCSNVENHHKYSAPNPQPGTSTLNPEAKPHE